MLLLPGVAAYGAPDAKAPSGPPKPVKTEIIGVLGDSLGDGLWAGLYRLLRRNKKFTVVKKSQVSTGLTQNQDFDWVKTAQKITKDPTFQVAVILLGANDQQALEQDKKWYRFRSEKWTKIYTGRITAMLKALKKKHLEVYWVGLPVMQRAGFDDGARFLDGLYKKAAAEQNVPYIDIRNITCGEDGKYAAHYKDRRGKMRLMRADDGVHFTMRGYIEMASYVFGQIQDLRSKARKKKKLLGAAATALVPVRGTTVERTIPPAR